MKERFGLSFVQKYVISQTPISLMSDRDAYKAIHNSLVRKKDVLLIDQSADPTSCTLRPVSFVLEMNNVTTTANYLDPKLWTMPLYPNPSNLQPDASSRPMSFTTDQGTIISWTVYFQQDCLN